MDFDELVKNIKQISTVFKQNANTSINIHVTGQFYITYPQIPAIFTSKHFPAISKTMSDQLEFSVIKKSPQRVSQTTSDQSVKSVSADKLVQKLSFSHFVELLSIRKRAN